MYSHAHMYVSMYVGTLEFGVEGRKVVYVTFNSTVELREEPLTLSFPSFSFRGFSEEELSSVHLVLGSVSFFRFRSIHLKVKFLSLNFKSHS